MPGSHASGPTHVASSPFRTLSTSAPGAVKDVDLAKRTVTGYFSTFGFKDSYGDVIQPGAFVKTVAQRGPAGTNRIWHLDQHDPYRRLAKPGVLKEDETGLYFESTLPDTALARDILVLYQEGHITEHSIGYDVVVGEWNSDEKIYYLKEVRLWEGSCVTWGANEHTPTLGVKSLDDAPGAIERLAARMKSAERLLHRGPLTDETCEVLELQLRQWRADVLDLNTLLQKGQGSPDAGSPPPADPTDDWSGTLAALKSFPDAFTFTS